MVPVNVEELMPEFIFTDVLLFYLMGNRTLFCLMNTQF